MASKLDLVGIDDIASRLKALGVEKVTRSTVSSWQRLGWPAGERGATVKAPKLLGIVSKRIAVYNWPEVERWARETNRLP